jgi:hypothetical protein
MDMHLSIVFSGWCFKTNRTTVLSLSMHFQIVKSGYGDSKQIGQQYCHALHALQSCQIRMVLQNKSDNSNGHALKWSNFRLNLSFEDVYRRNVPIFENFLGNENFAKRNFAKLRENLLIFASFSLFAKMEKTVFVSTLVTSSGSILN